jgi:hypothetical protein
MKIWGHPVTLMVDMGTKHLVVTQSVCPFSKKHTTITGATGDQAHCPFLVSRQCNLGNHEVRHEFLYLPVVLMGRDLCKLRAEITFDLDGTAALKLRGPMAKTNSHSCTRRGIVVLCPEGSPPEIPLKIPVIWTR